MAGLGLKVEQEDSCSGPALAASGETLKASPSRDWSGSHPLEVRQLTPPLSCSPSVRRRWGVCGRSWEPLSGTLEGSSLSPQDGSPGKELKKDLSLDRAEGQSNLKEGRWKHFWCLTWAFVRVCVRVCGAFSPPICQSDAVC